MRTVMVRDSNGSAKVPPVALAQPPLEKSALGVIGDQRERSRVALRRFRRGSETAQQIGARGMQQVVAVEVAGGGQRFDERERRSRAVHHRDRGGAVQGDDGGGLQPAATSAPSRGAGAGSPRRTDRSSRAPRRAGPRSLR